MADQRLRGPLHLHLASQWAACELHLPDFAVQAHLLLSSRESTLTGVQRGKGWLSVAELHLVLLQLPCSYRQCIIAELALRPTNM